MNTSSPSSTSSRAADFAVDALMSGLYYVATADGQFTDEECQCASRVLSDVLNQFISKETVADVWERQALAPPEMLARIRQIAAMLPLEVRQVVLISCARMVSLHSNPSWDSKVALDRIANALRFNAAESAVLIAQGMPTNIPATMRATASRSNATIASTGARKRRFPRWVIAVLALAASLLTVYAVDAFYDRDQYQAGYARYQAADCRVALSYMNRVAQPLLFSWDVGMGNMVQALAATVVEQCREMAEAEYAHVYGDLPKALLLYGAAGRNPITPEVIKSASHDRAQALVAATRPALLAAVETCDSRDTLEQEALLPISQNNMLEYLMTCGDVYHAAGKESNNYAVYARVLHEYPRTRAAARAEQALLSLSATCENIEHLMSSAEVRSRTDFVAEVYLGCAQSRENAKRYDDAVNLLEQFRRDFKRHPRILEIDAMLASILHKRALAQGAQELSQPEPSGTTASGETVISIQNSAPESVRLSYTGPESGVLEIPACSTCVRYRGSEPEACPELGETAELKLLPGTYKVTVEASSNGNVTPFIGSWKLDDGWVYAECYYIVSSRTF